MTHSGKAKVTLPTDEQILITREFDAPKHLVFRAWTTPSLVQRWWAGVRGEMKVVDIDFRVGGKWRYVMLAHGNFDVAFHGEFSEIVPNERIVTTEIYEGAPEPAPGQEVINTITFHEHSSRTQLSLLVQCPNKEVRDLIGSSGMEEGMQEQMDVLEDLARSL
ncbi:MAG: ATPase [Myxococcales bacterium]|nr:MAG: ATPase [Myxococcales bacterium]